LCDGFSFETTTAGLEKLEERIFSDGSNPIIIFEPTGLAWLPVAVYLKARHPDSRLVRVQAQKVVALRKYLNRSSKSDKIDSLTLAKMPFIDPEKLEEIYFPRAKSTPYNALPVSGGGWRMKSRVARRGSGPLSMDISRAYEAHFQIPGQPTPGLS